MATISETFAAALQHHQAGNLQSAEQLYQQILAVDPDHVDSLHLLGMIASARGQYDAAIVLIRRAISWRANDAVLHNNLGTVLQEQELLDEAIACFQRAIEILPEFAEAHNNLSEALRSAARIDEALEACRRALQLKPELAEAHNNLGNILWSKGKYDEAFDAYTRAAQLRPDLAAVYSNLGNALQFQGKLEEAEAHCHRAIDLNSRYPLGHNNLGNVFLALGRFEEAVASYRRAVELKSDYAEAWSNLGNGLQHLGRMDEANAAYVRALEIDTGNAYAHYGRATLNLLHGNFDHGWPEYEWRLETNRDVQRHLVQPQWDGGCLGERTIFLHGEQCLGDTIQLVRFAAVVKSRNPSATVIVECQRPLLKLLLACPGIDRLIAHGDELPPLDVFASLMSLPAILRTELHTVPASIPYLAADPALVRHWQKRLEPARGIRIGVNWVGQPMTRHRNIPISLFLSLAAMPDVYLISLQKRAAPAGSTEAQPDYPPMIDFGNGLDSVNGAFMDTAAIMMNLDLVISCDTSVAHLAGALGVPVWVGLPYVPDWRWMLDRTDTPWYSTMRLFRQKQVGDWTAVMRQIQDELTKWCSKPFSRGRRD
jgi:tetratricopeptide (TPR) repeat protein